MTRRLVVACLMAEPEAVSPLEVVCTCPDRPGETRCETCADVCLPENAARALGRSPPTRRGAQPPALLDLRRYPSSRCARSARPSWTPTSTDWLTAEKTRRVLNAFGLPLLPTVIARNADEAAAPLRCLVFPVVAKPAGRALAAATKSDVGAVRVGLLGNARSALPSASCRRLPPNTVRSMPMKAKASSFSR